MAVRAPLTLRLVVKLKSSRTNGNRFLSTPYVPQKRMQAGYTAMLRICYKDILSNLRNTYFSFALRSNSQLIVPRQGNEVD